MTMRIVAVVVFLAACGGSKPSTAMPETGGDTPVSNTPSGGDTSVANTPTSGDTPVGNTPSTAGVPCAQEIALACGSGLEDGCGRNVTTVHACIQTGAKSGPSCDAEIALSCPDGMADACSVTPPAATAHVCIRR